MILIVDQWKGEFYLQKGEYHLQQVIYNAWNINSLQHDLRNSQFIVEKDVICKRVNLERKTCRYLEEADPWNSRSKFSLFGT